MVFKKIVVCLFEIDLCFFFFPRRTLIAKLDEESKALQLCQTKVKAKKLPMEVVDAEYQWDRRKLTFYFIADKRIDFRELVRELFRYVHCLFFLIPPLVFDLFFLFFSKLFSHYKTRIWMASVAGGVAYEQ